MKVAARAKTQTAEKTLKMNEGRAEPLARRDQGRYGAVRLRLEKKRLASRSGLTEKNEPCRG